MLATNGTDDRLGDGEPILPERDGGGEDLVDDRRLLLEVGGQGLPTRVDRSPGWKE